MSGMPRPNSAVVTAMDKHGTVHRKGGCAAGTGVKVVACNLAQAYAWGSGVCASCWPGGAPWHS